MQFRLLADHVNPDQQVIPGGTKIGDDTSWPWRDRDGKPLPVTTQMDGLDDEGRQMVSDLHRKLYGKDMPYWQEPEEARKAHEQQAAAQQRLDENSEPVSEEQKRERAVAEAKDKSPQPLAVPPGPARQPSHTATASPTRGGNPTPSPGPATPQPPKAEETRPKNPNADQYPKG